LDWRFVEKKGKGGPGGGEADGENSGKNILFTSSKT